MIVNYLTDFYALRPYSQPVDFFHMGQRENELVNNPIGANGPADELQRGVVRVVEDKMVEVEMAQAGPSNASG